jgi:hypothetical protein
MMEKSTVRQDINKAKPAELSSRHDEATAQVEIHNVGTITCP